MRRWLLADPSRPVDLPLTDGTLMDFAPLPGGGWLFAAADPAWGVLNAAGQLRHRQDPPIADLRGPQRLRLSADGRRVRFSLQERPELPRSFDVASRTLGADDAKLAPARSQETPGLVVRNWRHDRAPTLNGQPIVLDALDMSRSLAISADGQRFVLGSEWALRLIAKDGGIVWRRNVPGVVWAVNLSADQRFVVAAYGDGTIRWHRLDNGNEILALLPHRDGQRWVAWTPEGFYAASGADAEEWMGYHLNRGRDREGEFVSARQLRNAFYQPALISGRLDAGGDVLMSEAVAKLGDVQTLLAGARNLPPEVELLSTDELVGEQEVTVRFKVIDRGGGFGRLNFYVDGQPLLGRPAGLAADGTESRSFPLPPGRRRIEVAATSSGGVEGVRRAIDAHLTGPSQDAALHIFAVGVQTYKDPALRLRHSAADAIKVAEAFAEGAKPVFKRGVFVAPVLTDQRASLDEIERGFEQLVKQVRPQDTLVIFLAGHGEAPIGQGYTFLPWDFERAAAGKPGKSGNVLDEQRLRRWLEQSPSQTLLLLDTCDAGAAVKVLEGSLERLAGLSKRVLIGASREGQFALEGYKGQGVFTAALLRVLSAKPASDAEPELRVTRLRDDIEVEVRRIQREMGGAYRQQVSGYLGSANFPVARR